MKYNNNRPQLTPPQILVIGLLAIILIGTVLLALPVSSTEEPLTFIDALFTATSAASVTGLVVDDTGHRFTLFGQIIIGLLIQIGGIGFMTMATLFAIVFKRRISFRERLVLKDALNQNSMEGIIGLIRKVLLYSFAIEGAGALLLIIRWSMDMPFLQAVYHGLWHSISFFNNAGFDLLGPFGGLSPYVDDAMVNLVAMALIILGGIGFIVMADVLEFKKRRRLSLHTKVVLSMTSLLIGVGALFLFIFEYTNPETHGSLHGTGKIFASFFQSVSRTAGTSTVDIGSMRQASQFLLILLMFIGASPGSTGGGIKTTTFTILIGAVVAMIRGKRDIILFRFRLPEDHIFKAVTLTLLAFFFVLTATMLLSMTEPYPFLAILFEVTSAFGTVGMTMGITPDLSLFGKIVIILMMFIGRLGPLTLAYALGTKTNKELYKHPEGKMIIG